MQLPDGYKFIYGADINPTDVMTLREKGSWEPIDKGLWRKYIDESKVTVGIIYDGSLIGVGLSRVTPDTLCSAARWSTVITAIKASARRRYSNACACQMK